MNSHVQWQVLLPSRGAWHPYPPTQTRGNRSPQQTLQNKEHVMKLLQDCINQFVLHHICI